MVNSPTCTLKIDLNVGKYTSPMDPMGIAVQLDFYLNLTMGLSHKIMTGQPTVPNEPSSEARV